MPGNDPPRHSSLDPVPLQAAEIMNMVAGRLVLFAERPTHTKALVSLGLFAKRPSRPTAGVMLPEPIETRRGEVAEGLTYADFPDVRGLARLVRSGRGKCGAKRQGPEKRLEPLGTASCESCKYHFGPDSRSAQPHLSAAPARLTERTNDVAVSLGSGSGKRKAHGHANSHREGKCARRSRTCATTARRTLLSGQVPTTRSHPCRF